MRHRDGAGEVRMMQITIENMDEMRGLLALANVDVLKDNAFLKKVRELIPPAVRRGAEKETKELHDQIAVSREVHATH